MHTSCHPVHLLRRHFRHQRVVAADGSIFRAIDIARSNGNIEVVMLASHASCGDLTAPSCWTVSPGIGWNAGWNPSTVSTHSLPQHLQRSGRAWEEPGAILNHATGEVSVMVRIDAFASCPTLDACNRAILLSYDKAASMLAFKKLVRFPSSCNKFAVRQDVGTGWFYSLTNPVTLAPSPTCEIVYTTHSSLSLSLSSLSHTHANLSPSLIFWFAP